VVSAWRIVKRRYAHTAFDGEGARAYGGRWIGPGRPVIYVSESRALATLEVLAGLKTSVVVPAYVLIRVDFDEALVKHVDPNDLGTDWRASPPTSATQRIGDEWLDEATSAALRVPSAVVPGEFNYLLNPRHSDFGTLRVGTPEELYLDPRLLPH
jgi:RES domain-containing protein